MSRFYDNWEKLVGAVLKREQLRRIALSPSLSSSTSADFSSRFSFNFSLQDVLVASTISTATTEPEASSSQSIFPCSDIQPIDLTEIKRATKNFRADMFLVEGQLSQVFEGWIDEHTLTASEPGSGMAVSVKKWNQDGLQSHQYWLEDNMISVYAFMPKGSLDNHFFRRGHPSLSWATRIKVAVDAARGLSFLHERERPVIHRDIQAANIFLDEEFNAKLPGFSLARDGPTIDTSRSSTLVIGSYGYVAPEYLMNGWLTSKCDVYGFGVVLLELLSGLRADDRNQANEQNLADWAKPYLGNKRKLLKIMDTRLDGQYPHNGAYKVAKLASQCLNTWPHKGPSMAEVVVALELI